MLADAKNALLEDEKKEAKPLAPRDIMAIAANYFNKTPPLSTVQGEWAELTLWYELDARAIRSVNEVRTNLERSRRY